MKRVEDKIRPTSGKLNFMRRQISRLSQDKLNILLETLEKNIQDDDWLKKYDLDPMSLPRDGIIYARYYTCKELGYVR